MELKITDEGIEINDILINEEIFNKELINYCVRDREDLIDDLIDWISEATTDKEVMEEDLKYLIGLNCKYLFSSILTNEYISKEDNEDEFNEICKEILEKNDKDD